MSTKRKVITRACDGCKIRKIKCTELPPCDGCGAAGIPCTFKKTQGIRGPRRLRAKTIERIGQRQKLYADNAEQRSIITANLSPDVGSAPGPSVAVSELTSQGELSGPKTKTSVGTLVLRLRIYRLRLFPIWPIIAVETIITSLETGDEDVKTYTLANAIGAATMAQLKLDSPSDTVTATSLEAECQRSRMMNRIGQLPSLNSLRIAFFLHIYHENLEAGGIQSLLYLREALTLAQILGLHREATYSTLSVAEQEMRRRIIWLLFVTERGVSMLHHLPVMLKCDVHFPSTEGEDESHVLPAFRKLVNLFWLFDHSGAFDMLQDAGVECDGSASPYQHSLDILQQRLQDIPIDWESSNDVQRADICVTRQWMRAVLWKMSRSRQPNSTYSASSPQPIQFAKEFLAVVSRLPNSAIEAHGPSIELKIFEIASAVTDSLFPSTTSKNSISGVRQAGSIFSGS